MDVYDNKKGQSLDEFESKSDIYIFLPLFSQKELNHLIDLGKKIKSLNQLIYILKFG